jgi:glutaredoxin 3|tara:strand:- start:203 stop:466 length:264 start_codon:yes stop_codon:yes gene_type:complete
MQNKIIVYTSNNCSYCVRAKKLLEQKGLSYEEINIQIRTDQREEMISKSNGKRTVPQIFINEAHIGGFQELNKIAIEGNLEKYLSDG